MTLVTILFVNTRSPLPGILYYNKFHMLYFYCYKLLPSVYWFKNSRVCFSNVNESLPWHICKHTKLWQFSGVNCNKLKFMKYYLTLKSNLIALSFNLKRSVSKLLYMLYQQFGWKVSCPFISNEVFVNIQHEIYILESIVW